MELRQAEEVWLWAVTPGEVKVLAGSHSDAAYTTAETIEVTYIVDGVFIIDRALGRCELS